MELKLALAQINTKLGVVESNLEKHLLQIEQAKKDGAQLVIFPELSLTGYVLQDLVPTVAHRAESSDPIFKQLLFDLQPFGSQVRLQFFHPHLINSGSSLVPYHPPVGLHQILALDHLLHQLLILRPGPFPPYRYA